MSETRRPEDPTLLPVLYQRIERRCLAVAEAKPPWPCHQGCDHCCRNLARPPSLVRAEWRRLEEGLAALDPESRAEIRSRLAIVAEQTSGPVVCPFLDTEAGSCRVYEHRPAACRTYGFYQSRDGGRFCHLVETHVSGTDVDSSDGDSSVGDSSDSATSPFEHGIVWGSQQAIDNELERLLGPTIPLDRWWRDFDASTTLEPETKPLCPEKNPNRNEKR